MRVSSCFVLFLLVFCTAQLLAECTLQGPPQQKSAADDEMADSQEETSEVDDDSSSKIMADPIESAENAARLIKILKTTEFNHDVERQKELALLRQFIIDGYYSGFVVDDDETQQANRGGSSKTMSTEPLAPPPPPQSAPIKSEEELEMDTLYEEAVKLLNKSRYKERGNFIMSQIALRGHSRAMAHVAWQQLLNGHVGDNIAKSRTTLENLSKQGLPEAHMVSGKI